MKSQSIFARPLLCSFLLSLIFAIAIVLIHFINGDFWAPGPQTSLGGIGGILLLFCNSNWQKRLQSLILFASVLWLTFALICQSLDLITLGIGPVSAFIWFLIRFCIYTRKLLTHGKNRWALLWIVIAQILIALTFPPLPFGFMIVPALVLWLWAMRQLQAKEAGTLSFWGAIPGQLICFYWVANVLQAGFWLAVGGGLTLLLLFLSIFPALSALVFVKLRKHAALIWLFPFWAVGLEVIRAWGEISFPWLPLGATMGDYLQILQVTSWIGAYGLSLILWLMAMVCYSCITHKKWWPIALVPLFSISIFLCGHWQLSQTEPKTNSLRITLVQPNQNQKLKWDHRYFQNLMENMWTLTQKTDLSRSDLIVFPETSIPNFIEAADPWDTMYQHLAQSHHTPIFMGILDIQVDSMNPRGGQFYNSGFLFDPRLGQSQYNKVRLVPFSEALPFGKLFPVINYVSFGEGDFSPGDGAHTMNAGGHLWSPNICYEIIYPDFVRQQIHMGSELMVEITNDGWFGQSTQPWQHLNLVRLRAIENGIPVVRSTNTGITAAIDAHGRILKQLPPFQEGTLQIQIPLRQGKTLYSRIGDLVELCSKIVFALISIFLIFVHIQRRQKC